MSTRDWKLGEVVYLKSGSPAMTVIGTDSHGATKVQWYDPQAMEAERSMFPTVVFPKDCLTEVVTPQLQWEMGARMSQLQAEPFRITSSDLIVAHQPSTEDLTQTVLTTLRDLFSRLSRTTEVATSKFAAEAQPNEKIVEATSRAAEPQKQHQAQIPPILGAIQKAANASLDPAAREFREKAVASGALSDGAQPVQQPTRRKG
jgi:uncharacterized protein YodC (DUF2158 family)